MSTADQTDHGRPPTTFETWLYRIIAGALRGLCKAAFRMRVTGKEHIPATGPFILAPVHRSNLDFALVLATDPGRRMRYLAKDSLWKNGGFWAKLFTALGGIPVARGTADRESLRACVAVIEAGEPLVIFPEGARQSGPKLTELFDGPAFVQSRTGVDIIPVGIGGSEAAMPVGAKLPKLHKITLVIGPKLAPIETDGPKARRAAVKTRTAELAEVLQGLFDEAQELAGSPNR